MPIPGSEPPPPPPTPGVCTTPDPFVAIPGLIGICQDGNWIPVPGVSGAGTIVFVPVEGGFWGIEHDGGLVYVPLVALSAGFQVEGLRVTFEGILRPDVTSVFGVPVLALRTITPQ
jgi:hypothetical protein